MYNPVSCLHPSIVRNKFTGDLVCVPCGRCSSCVTRKSMLWTSRLQEESTCHTYTMFCTLTYDDAHLPKVNLNELYDRYSFDENVLSSSKDFIDFNHGNIPCLRVADFQKFFKRLRYYISHNYGTQTNIRYFLVGEYGPTTFRPHCHFLLWFDSPDLVSTIKGYIFQAWKYNTPYQSLSAFLRRNKCVFVHGNAERYVAGYLNMFSHLPPILTCKPFRPFHIQSSCPPIGTIRVFKDTLERLQSGDVSQITLHRLSSGQPILLPMWRGLENRLFPKCIGFSRVTSSDRRTLYGISRLFGEAEFYDFNLFSKRFLPEWFSDKYPFSLVRKLCGDSSSLDTPDLSCINSLKRLFNISRRCFETSFSLSISFEDYVSRIEAYYSRKDYVGLVDQLKYQEWLSNNPRSDVSIQYYPFLVDSLFYDNLRNLSSDTFQSYLNQFGLDSINDFMFTPAFSYSYKERKSLTDKIYFDNHKVKVKKDYVSNHPECIRNYSLQLKSFTL